VLFEHGCLSNNVNAVAWNPHTNELAAGDSQGWVQIWGDFAGQFRMDFFADAPVLALAWSSEGSILAAGGADHKIRLLNTKSGEWIRTFHGNAGTVSSLCWSASGDILAAGGTDGTIQIWSGHEGQQLGLLAGHTAGVMSVACSPDGQYVASVGEDDTVRIWEVHSARAIHVLPALARPWPSAPVVYSSPVVFSDDGRSIITSSEAVIRFWDPTSGTLQRRMFCNVCGKFIAVSPNGGLIATAGRFGGAVRLADGLSGEERGVLFERGVRRLSANALSWSHDGRFLGVGFDDEIIQIWVPASKSLKAVIETRSRRPLLRKLEYLLKAPLYPIWKYGNAILSTTAATTQKDH
jgi:WD40 repeat protein